jgi:hypothetical protein
MNPPLGGGSARIREYASLWLVTFGNRRLHLAAKTQPGIRKEVREEEILSTQLGLGPWGREHHAPY